MTELLAVAGDIARIVSVVLNLLDLRRQRKREGPDPRSRQ